uniref:DUF3299 domain-containing protein n=1 Tax=Candidatus Kentrum sp. FW TaxID=2126338 RepID=A0A450SJZ9_9GAMM|nr:MAG: hypothetical protein BECKFW1821A_GA0114235_104419 [Candidatus Kentron sp. FW]VFJ58585.1 MAG: hypothetical protein BECKFW1821B_GA0114236_104219 [Candidatus Kentron sp. FW]
MKKSRIHAVLGLCSSIFLIAGLAAGALRLDAAETARKITWDALISEDYSLEATLAKYEKQIEELDDGDPETEALYQKILAEISNAPVNEKIDKEWVKLAGFIAPLSHENDRITEFLFVPYFGACIHVPPPPVNQIVLVKTAPDHSIPLEESFFPIWVSGQIRVEGKKTELGEAGYRIEDAVIETYEEQ